MSKYDGEVKKQPFERLNIYFIDIPSVFNRYIYIAARTNIYMTIYLFLYNNTFTYGNISYVNIKGRQKHTHTHP